MQEMWLCPFIKPASFAALIGLRSRTIRLWAPVSIFMTLSSGWRFTHSLVMALFPWSLQVARAAMSSGLLNFRDVSYWTCGDFISLVVWKGLWWNSLRLQDALLRCFVCSSRTPHVVVSFVSIKLSCFKCCPKHSKLIIKLSLMSFNGRKAPTLTCPESDSLGVAE